MARRTMNMLGLVALVAAGPAFAQTSPGLSTGQVPTATQWNSYFAAKQDYFGSLGTGTATALAKAPGDVTGGFALAGQTGGGAATISYTPSGTYADLPNVGSSSAASVAVPTGSPAYLAIVNYGPVAVSVSQTAGLTFATGDIVTPFGTLIVPRTGTTVYAITSSGTTNVRISGVTTTPDATIDASVKSPIPAQASGAAVGIGGVKICDASSTANPLTPCAAVTSAGVAVYDAQLHADVTSSIPAGANLIGAVSFQDAATGAVLNSQASAPINVSTATTTQLVALSGTMKIYVTSFDVVAGGTGNITFEYGTGTACATSPTALTGAYPLTAQAGIAKGSGVGAVLIVPAGNALCVLTSAAVQMSGSVSYVRQ